MKKRLIIIVLLIIIPMSNCFGHRQQPYTFYSSIGIFIMGMGLMSPTVHQPFCGGHNLLNDWEYIGCMATYELVGYGITKVVPKYSTKTVNDFWNVLCGLGMVSFNAISFMLTYYDGHDGPINFVGNVIGEGLMLYAAYIQFSEGHLLVWGKYTKNTNTDKIKILPVIAPKYQGIMIAKRF